MQATPPKVPPVSADMETVCSQGSGTVTSSSKFFRDEMSRTRVETGDLASISDPVKGQSFVLNTAQKIAIPAQSKPPMPGMPSLPGMPKPALPQFQPPQMQEAKDLGTKMINGIKCHGKQFTMPQIPGMPQAPQVPGMPAVPQAPAVAGMPKPPAVPGVPGMPQVPTSEIWTSHELHLPIQSTVTNPATGTNCVTQMKNIVPGAKLPPSMFQVPPDYKIATPPPPVQTPAVSPPPVQAPSVQPPPSPFGKK
jgi:hypothetical protein